MVNHNCFITKQKVKFINIDKGYFLMLLKRFFAVLIISLLVVTSAKADRSPSAAALGIMVEALASLKEYRGTGKTSIEDVEDVIVAELLPSLDITESTRIALKKYWSDLTPKQQLILKTYIATSLVDNYSSVLHSYQNLDNIKVSVDPNVKRKDNKAIVKMYIAEAERKKPVMVTLKMMLSGNDWHIYDVVLSGVSLVKNYRANFNSHIKRKGVESLIIKATKKLRKHSKENCPVCLSMGLQQAMLDAENKF